MSDDTKPPVPLAIVGMGCLFPRANNPVEFWTNIRDGIDTIGEIPASHWRPGDYFDADPAAPDMTYARRGGFLDPVDFDPLLYGLSPNNLEATDTTQLLGMVVARQALLDAGYSTGRDNLDGRPFDRDRTSVILGVTGTLELVIPLGARLGHPLWRKALDAAGVEPAVAEEVVRRISDSYVPWQENSFPGLLGNVAAGRIANRFDLGGTNCVVDAACASSLSALHLAALELEAGRADMAISGGFDTFNDIFMYMCFSKTPALSPTGDSRPFDAGGDGTILGEGLGAVVLKRLDDARRDNDRIYAIIRGIGSSSDGRGNAIYAPSAGGQTRALKNAYHAAGIRPGTIELVEAHGTGTKVGDAVEARALSAVYREDRAEDTWCALGSVKSMIGHTKAAAGVAGLIKVAMALHHKVLPPTLKVERPLDLLDPGEAPVYVNTGKRPWIADPRHPRRAAVSAFGFGGSNFHCVLEEANPAKPATEWDGQVLLMAFSAGSRRELAAALNRLDPDAGPAALRLTAANSLRQFRREAVCRLVLAIRRGTDVKRLIEDSLRMLGAEQQSWHLPEGAWFGAGGPPGKLALLFPGQGAQYPGMLLDLACQFPAMQAVLAGADASFGPVPGALRLSGLIYPIPVFTEEARRQQAEILRRTVYAQPAIGAVSLGALRVLEGFGVGFDAAAGHSFGELTALCAAGRFDDNALHRLAARRGELMQPGVGDHGAMLAVAATAAVIHEILEAEQLDLIIANHNAPRQVVLSGASDQIERAVGLLAKRGIGATRLPVSAAFHSSFVAEAEKPFARYLREVTFREGKVPVYANTTAEPYPVSGDKARELLAAQLAQPVEFVAELENLYAAGVRTFLECGPGHVLTGLAGAILGERAHTAVAVDASRGRIGGQYDLAAILAQLAALGHEVELAHWDEDYPARHAQLETGKPALSIALTGANYVRPRQESAPEPAAGGSPAGPPPAPRVSPARVTSGTPATPDPAPRPALAPAPAPVHEAILALQRMQEQTAELHRHYLEGQEAAQQAILKLLERQAPNPVPYGGVPQPELPQVAAAVAPRQEMTGVTAQTRAPAAAVPTAAPARRDDHALESLLLEVVSDKTGYPVDMLSMEMSLDTDLGIDSIKRVEILSALQERLPGSRKIQPADLGTFRLLQHIVEFLLASEDEAAAAPPPPAPACDRLCEHLLEVVADKTGYPVDMLNLDMSLDTDLGIDSIKRVEILSAFQEKMPDAPAVRPEDLATLQTLRQIIDFMQVGSAAAKPAPSPENGGVADDYTDALLAVVADKTGYPVDMLNLDMNLDTDLGIDSIKRVEILSAFQEKMPDAPPVRPEGLAALQTLRQITDFMQCQPAAGGPATPKTSAQAADLADALLAVVAEKTGYPVDMLNPDMHLDTDLGIDSIKRVEILSAFQEKMPDAPAVRPEDLAALQTLRQIVDFMSAGDAAVPAVRPEPDAPDVAPSTTLWSGAPVRVPLSGAELRPAIALADGATIHITDNGTGLPARLRDELMSRGLDARVIPLDKQHPEADASGLIVIAPLQPEPAFNLRAFELIRAYAPELRHSGGQRAALLAGVTCLGGGFGIEPAPADDPVAAGLSGIVKTADKEWPEVECKTLDLDWSEEGLPDLAAALADELLRQGPLEVGLRDGQRWTLELQAAPQDRAEHEPLAAGDLVVISGGARGVTAEAAVALAALRVNLLLLGRSPQPEPEPAWLQDIVDEAAVKRAIRDNAAGDMTPREVEARYRGIQAAREIRRTLVRIAEQGGGIMYRAADVRDRDSLAAALEQARHEFGPVRGLIHGAGVLADRSIEDKTPAQFREVYTTKVDGLQALLDAMDVKALRLLVLFSSSTARFGRKGQADYAAANEVLNKTAQRHRVLHPGCRVASMNWGPWDGGMVTPQLKQLFAAEGVAVIPLRAGADHLLRVINGRGPVETVVLGSAPQGLKAPRDDAGSLPAGMHTAFERRVGLEEMPMLASHVINGKAVLPVALMVEWFAHGAMHGHPGLRFTGFQDFKVYKGVVLEPGAEAGLSILAGAPREADGRLYVPVELRRGEVLHAGARVLLGGGYEEPGRPAIPVIAEGFPLADTRLYEAGRLFHGPDLRGIATTPHCTREGISAGVQAAPHPGAWMRQPIRTGWIADPLVLDAAFQLMILWSFEQLGTGSLPSRIAEYTQYRRQYPKDGAAVNITVSAAVNSTVRADIEFVDRQGVVIARMHGYECVADASLNEAFRRNRAVGEPQP